MTLNKSILVIDDEEMVRETLTAFLEAAGYSVSQADDGRTGLRQFEANPTDLVLCDIIMEDMDGIETIRSLKTLSPSVKILAVTGGSQMTGIDYLSFAKQLGADAVLRKPFRRDQLLEALSEL